MESNGGRPINVEQDGTVRVRLGRQLENSRWGGKHEKTDRWGDPLPAKVDFSLNPDSVSARFISNILSLWKSLGVHETLKKIAGRPDKDELPERFRPPPKQTTVRQDEEELPERFRPPTR